MHILMKIYFLFACLFFCLKATSQDSPKSKWLLSINSGVQAHDKRLFNFSGSANLLNTQPGFFGTYQFGVGILKETTFKNQSRLYYGFQLSSELSTFRRPFDHKFGKTSGHDGVRYTNRYYKVLLTVPIQLNIHNSKKIDFLIEVLPQLSVFTKAYDSRYDYTEKFNWSRLVFHSVELNPGLDYKLGNSIISLKYRLFQLKKIDRIIFNYTLDDPRIDQTFETYNPVKFMVSFYVGLGNKNALSEATNNDKF